MEVTLTLSDASKAAEPDSSFCWLQTLQSSSIHTAAITSQHNWGHCFPYGRLQCCTSWDPLSDLLTLPHPHLGSQPQASEGGRDLAASRDVSSCATSQGRSSRLQHRSAAGWLAQLLAPSATDSSQAIHSTGNTIGSTHGTQQSEAACMQLERLALMSVAAQPVTATSVAALVLRLPHLVLLDLSGCWMDTEASPAALNTAAAQARASSIQHISSTRQEVTVDVVVDVIRADMGPVVPPAYHAGGTHPQEAAATPVHPSPAYMTQPVRQGGCFGRITSK
jgi:hypothetical protein